VFFPCLQRVVNFETSLVSIFKSLGHCGVLTYMLALIVLRNDNWKVKVLQKILPLKFMMK